MKDNFLNDINQSYSFTKKSITLGVAKLNNEAVDEAIVKAPLRMFNRHGLISGATGTGKTKTIQLLAEMLSEEGVPCLLMDIKGDLSGLAAEGVSNAKIDERHQTIGNEWQAKKFPVELLTISGKNGVQMRATVSEFGPVLFSRILDLNDTQSGVVSLVFKYCDDNKYPLLDLKDFKKTLQYLTNEGKREIEKEYGKISPASTGTIMRKIIELEEQRADIFFGEESFDVYDLMRRGETGRGFLNIIRVDDIQNNPRLFSTFMLCLMAEIYSSLPEIGDQEQPELVIFIDEAHLVFSEATKALQNQIETMVK
ncbi:MAG: helicase HerA-like domain-containing protein, partial [Bacteroidia bacterium]